MEKIDSVSVTLNPSENGGEQAELTVELYDNGDGMPDGLYTLGTVVLNSYGNTASVTLGVEITPSMLRDFANDLEVAIAKAVARRQ